MTFCISPLYPPFVDVFKPTICGLPKIARAGDLADMTDQQFHAIGERLQAIRTAFSDLSQKAWAEKHGFNQTQYNNWEKGTRRIPLEQAERLCSLYGLTLDFLYLGRRDGLAESARKLL